MRKRTTTTPAWPRSDATVIRRNPITGATDTYTIDSGELPYATAQSMTDQPKRTGALYQECFHTKVELTDMGYQPTPNSRRYVDYTGAVAPEGFIISLPTSTLYAQAIAVFPEFGALPDWRTYLKWIGYPGVVRKAWKKPEVSLYKGFSIINSVFEFAENLAMVKAWTSHKALYKRWHSIRAANGRLSTAAQAIANERLAHVYGTKQLMRDAYSLFQASVGLRDKLLTLMKYSGCTLRKYYKGRKFFRLHPIDYGERSFPIFDCVNSTLTMSRNVEVHLNSVLYFSYAVPSMKSSLTRFAAICDSLGIRLDAGIVWDSIPKSFVVDWFINVSQWLHENVSYGDWFKVIIKWIDFGHSAKLSVVDVLMWRRNVAEPGIPGTFVHEDIVFRKVTTIYRRQRDDLPEFGKVTIRPDERLWSVDRAINALALAVSLAHRPGRRFAKGWFGYQD